MFVKRGFWKIFGITATVVIVPTVVIAGYFTIGTADKYRGFYVNPSNDGLTGFLSAYRGAVLQGAEIILTPGFNHAAPIEASFKESPDFFKDTGFLFFDGNVTSASTAAPNTWSMTYRADLGSIQVGIASAYFLNYYQDHFKDDGKLTYATWGGLPYASVTSFMGGFQKGVEWANEKLVGKTINGNTYEKVEQIFGSTDLTGGFSPSDGISLMTQIISQRPDVLMPVAGPQVWTANDQINLLKNSKTVLIGVDSPVEDDSRNQAYPFTTVDGGRIGNGKRVQFSSLKDLARSAATVMQIVNNGNIVPAVSAEDPNQFKNFSATGTAGEAGGFGTIAVGDSQNGCVGISPAGANWFTDAIASAGEAVGFDPSTDPKYSEIANMAYIGVNGVSFDYGAPPFGLQQAFSLNNTTGAPNLLKAGVVGNGVVADKSKFRIVLSSVGSILMDSSFSQSCYLGLYTYLKSMSIDIPPPTGGAE